LERLGNSRRPDKASSFIDAVNKAAGKPSGQPVFFTIGSGISWLTLGEHALHHDCVDRGLVCALVIGASATAMIIATFGVKRAG
jgi:hypothetical protein